MENGNLDNLHFDGGCIVFDFTNTINNRNDQVQKEYLHSADALLKWAEKAGVLPRKKNKKLLDFAEAHPVKAKEVLLKAVGAREILYKLFSSIAKQVPPAGQELQEFNVLLAESLSKINLSFIDSKAEINFSNKTKPLEEPLWLIIKSAFDILTTEDFERIKECPSCGWLFLDKTKNKKRRWCDMQVCGSNDKAIRYYYRKKAMLKTSNK